MKVRIDKSNIDKLNTAIAQGNGKSRERVLTVEQLFDSVEEVKDFFGIPKSNLKGLKVLIDVHHQKKAKAYKNAMYSTKALIEFSCMDAYLLDVKRDYVDEFYKFRVQELPLLTQTAILKKFKKF